MRWSHSLGLRRLFFPAIEALPGVFHGVFARWAPTPRHGDMPFNLGLDCGTPNDTVWLNRRRMLAGFGDDIKGVYARQVHGKQARVWKGPTAADHESHYLDGDALITDQPERGLVIQVADCQPVIIVDPVRRVVANVHSGWRGSVQNIIGATVARMVDEFHCLPHNLVCGVGPSLGPCCAEFVNYARELPEAIWRYRLPGDLFDFWRISTDQLKTAGVPSQQIHISQICTRCNQHLFYSYRGARQTGRFAAVVGLNAGKGRKHDSAKGIHSMEQAAQQGLLPSGAVGG